ncbi:serine hydrolase domain-containing protein [Sphingomicrobium nitratireducens]|uniref:serine hydrolase domain-containing protein n=1 Tax=Sphingomicrobium nitratireducens TaxID=2964666 RepID=UPI0022404097|nr:serine hydrolase domain-containing protein [Sphingomicrobium nitratireducens]
MILSLLLAAQVAAHQPHPVDGWFEAMIPGTIVVGEEPPARSIEALMAHNHVPGVQVTLIDDWKIVATRAYGLADAQSGRGNTPTTRFQAASISKPVATMAMLALVEAGTLDLDAPINSQLESWRLPDLEDEAAVTLRRLLSHTAGTSVWGFAGYGATDALPTTVQILDGVPPANNEAVRVVLEPGAQNRYSGGGFTIAELAAEDRAGEQLDRIAERLVFAPLGMDASSFAMADTFGEDVAIAHAHDGEGKLLDGLYHRYPEQAAASLWTTSDDIARFAIALGRASKGDEGLPLEPEMARTMLTPVMDGYGLGIGTGGEGADVHFTHSGSNAGFKSVFFLFPETGDGIVVLTNGDRGSSIFVSALLTAAKEMGWGGFEPRRLERASLDFDGLAEVAGTYRIEDTDYVLGISGDEFVLLDDDGSTERGIAIAGDKLYLPQDNQLLDIVRDEKGTVTALQFRSLTFRKVPPSASSGD